MKSKILKSPLLYATICLLIITIAGGCKKDQLIVDQTKQYWQVDHVATNAYDGGWGLTLQPDGVADVLPGGDVYYRGTYKISGSKITVETPQNSGSYTFKIISDTQIREKESGAVLALAK